MEKSLKLVEIAKAWAKFVQGSEETKQRMEQRLAICDECPQKRQLSPVGRWIVLMINKETSTFFCGSCGCPLAAKTAAPMETCPLNKWVSS